MPGNVPNPRQDAQGASPQAVRRPYVGSDPGGSSSGNLAGPVLPARDDRELVGDRSMPGRSAGRWRLRNWRLRWKLLIVLLVPLVTALALGALRVTTQLQNAGVYDKKIGRASCRERV